MADQQHSLAHLSLGKRIVIAAVGAFLMVSAAIGMVVAATDALASFGLRSDLSVPTGTYATGFGALWVVGSGALMALLHRSRGAATATASSDGVGIETSLER